MQRAAGAAREPGVVQKDARAVDDAGVSSSVVAEDPAFGRLGKVSSRAKRSPGVGELDCADLFGGGRSREGLAELGHQRGGERVAIAGRVERDPGNAAVR